MEVYKTKARKLAGKRYAELRVEALNIYKTIQRRTKRKPYLRSPYFSKQKVFFDYFWPHLFQKVPKERAQRLKYFAAAIELIRHSRQHPETKQDPNKPRELLHRFTGETKEGDIFYVQIKEDKRTGKLSFMSCFPETRQ